MGGFEKILKLAKEENGKFFIMDEKGDPRLVVMSMSEYESLKNQSSFSTLAGRFQELSEQTEILNKKITDMQKEDVDEEDYGENYNYDLTGNSEETEEENIYIEPIEE